MRRLYFILLALYIISGVFNYAGSLAYWQNKYNVNLCREDLAFSILDSIVPLWPIAGFFSTGFYEYGFQFTCGRQHRG